MANILGKKQNANGDNVFAMSHSDVVKMAGENKTLTDFCNVSKEYRNEVETISGKAIYLPSYKNGSSGNAGNNAAISNGEVIYAQKGDVVTVEMIRPADEGTYYVFGFCETNQTTKFVGIPAANRINARDYGHNTTENTWKCTDDACVAIVVTIAETDGSSYQSIQKSSYVSGEIFKVTVKHNGTIDELDKRTTSVEHTVDETFGVIGTKAYSTYYGNGTPLNSGNTDCVRSNTFVPCKKGDLITINMKRQVTDGYTYRYGFAELKVEKTAGLTSSDIATQREYVASGSYDNTYVVTKDATIGICVCVTESITEDGTTTYNTLRPSTQYGFGELFTIVVQDTSKAFIPEDYVRIDSFDPTNFVSNDTIEIQKSLLLNIQNNDFSKLIWDYTCNAGNSYFVANKSYFCTDYIPYHQGDIIKYHMGIANASAGINFYDKDYKKIGYKTGTAGIVTINPESSSYAYLANAAYFRVTFLKGTDDKTYGSYIKINDRYFIYYNEDFYNVYSTLNKHNITDEELCDLMQACQYGRYSNTGRNLQFTIITDTHSDHISVNNAIGVTNECNYLNFVIHCGDIVGSNFTDSAAVTDKANFDSSYAKAVKPMFVVIGNHDVGNSKTVSACATHEQAYTQWIKPIVDAGLIPENTEDEPNTDVSHPYQKCYYYKDFASYKVRLIVLYEFDDNLDLASGSTTTYRVQRGNRVIRQEQAQWFLDSLASAPSGYRIVIALHQAFSNNVDVVDSKFSQQGSYNLGTQILMNDFIADAVQAYIDRQNFTKKVVFSGDAAYLNTESADGVSYAYEVSKDFSSSVGFFHCYIGGHSHKDVVLQHKTYTKQKQVLAIDGNTSYYAQSTGNDIRRVNTLVNQGNVNFNMNKNGHPARDCITTVSVDTTKVASGGNYVINNDSNTDDKIRLTKIGIRKNQDGKPRDLDVVNINS